MMRIGVLLLGVFCMGSAVYGWHEGVGGWGWWLFGGFVFLMSADD